MYNGIKNVTLFRPMWQNKYTMVSAIQRG